MNVEAVLSISALWYAFGRQDAGERRVDPHVFRQHYDVLAANPNYRPSIQDAYDDYLKGIM